MPPNVSNVDISINSGVGRYLYGHAITLVAMIGTVQAVIQPGHKGRLVGLEWQTHVPGTGAGATVTLTPSINSVNLTGGVLTVTLAGTAAKAQRIASTPITGGNTFTANDAVTVTAAVGTAFTAGDGTLIFMFVNDDDQNSQARSAGGSRAANPD